MIRWLSIAAGIAATLLGLLLASHAQDTGIYVHGMILAVFGIGLNFWMIGHWPLEYRGDGTAD